MGDYFWSTGCRSDVEWFGYPGWGAYYRSRHGTFGVSGGVYQTFAGQGYECHYPPPRPWLGAPVKDYGWVAEMNYGRGCPGQWFENGAIGFHDGRWNIMYGRYGQSALRAAVRHPLRRLSQRARRGAAEQPPDMPDRVKGPPPPKH